jgi:hypothetical protein
MGENIVKLKLTVMVEDILIPLIVFAAIFGIVFVVVSARNRERMAMIEKGIDLKDSTNNNNKPGIYGILKWALLLAGVGFGLFLGSLLATYTDIQEEPAYIASALFFGGVGLAIAYLMARKAQKEK